MVELWLDLLRVDLGEPRLDSGLLENLRKKNESEAAESRPGEPTFLAQRSRFGKLKASNKPLTQSGPIKSFQQIKEWAC